MVRILKKTNLVLILITFLFWTFGVHKVWAAEPVKNRVLFVKDNIEFCIPFSKMLIEDFLDRSIGYVPRDLVRDGLPDFGASRDDWMGKERKHLGYDIYVNTVEVCVAADGIVSSTGTGNRAGLFVKVNHAKNIQTLYIHLTKILVKKGQKLKKSDVVGRIDGATGNAGEPQLHFEIKMNAISVDLLEFVKEYYKNNAVITEKIEKYIQNLKTNRAKRFEMVKKILKAK